jgi:hypothetical protein
MLGAHNELRDVVEDNSNAYTTPLWKLIQNLK